MKKMNCEVFSMDIKKVRIGFIGFGNMGQAMAKGWLKKGEIKPSQICASARNFEKLKLNCQKTGVRPFETSNLVVENADVIILAVKPNQVKEVIEPIKNLLSRKIIISVAAGLTYEDLKDSLIEGTQLLCTIPNTPVSVSEGIIIAEKHHSIAKEYQRTLTELLFQLGRVEVVETEHLSIAGTLAGCGPAFASMFIEALTDGAVKYGLPREEAYRLASQMMIGTGKMQLESNAHPGVMKDAITSPGGTTIKGVAALEQNGFRGSIISALDAIEG